MEIECVRLSLGFCTLTPPHWGELDNSTTCEAKLLLKTLLLRPPLVVLAGDVGTGKSEIAETIGDAVARQEKIDVSLLSPPI